MTSIKKRGPKSRTESSSAHLADLFDDHMAEVIDNWHDDTPPPPELEALCLKEATEALGRIDREVWIERARWCEPADRKISVIAMVLEHKGTEVLRKVRWSPFEKIWLMRTDKGCYTRFE